MALKDGFQAITRAPGSFSGQVRSGLSMANHRLQRSAREWATVPAQIPAQVLDRIVEAVRDRLDIPSRAEITDLMSRLEAVDQKLAQLEADKAELAAQVEEARKARPKPRASKPKATSAKTASRTTSTRSSQRAKTATANKTAKAKNGTKSSARTAGKATAGTAKSRAGAKKVSRKKTDA